jgi:hypothetical protein
MPFAEHRNTVVVGVSIGREDLHRYIPIGRLLDLS